MVCNWQAWVGSVLGSMLVGLSGVIPLFFIPDVIINQSSTFSEDNPKFRLLLSFAVGGLLGDVFLHLLPEAWHMIRSKGVDGSQGHLQLGLLLLSGLFSFAILERLLSSTGASQTETIKGRDCDSQNNNNGDRDIQQKDHHKSIAGNPVQGVSSKRITGYLNLVANGVDNFTHGLAVAGSFLVSTRVGFLTTAAILLHEIPHEVSDFAILLRAGFGRWDAARAQLATATAGLAGALAALGANGTYLSEGSLTSCVLPFTAGGFLHIALVTVLPELLSESQPKQSFLQALSLLAGIGSTAVVSFIAD